MCSICNIIIRRQNYSFQMDFTVFKHLNKLKIINEKNPYNSNLPMRIKLGFEKTALKLNELNAFD